ncbi:MAG: hypothetical protein QOE61_1676 [Micromonosporaceae bacterium]|jgi:hypothetical protein|nr:hypothetical protein [Micromonosporaceae bacterium]
MTARPLVADTFVVPNVFVTADFRLELLGPQHNEADHAAWMSSIEHIRSTPGFDRGWPPSTGMTLAENLADLASHAERSSRRVDFAYTVIEVATGEVIGCVYFKPSRTAGDDVEASSWVCAARAELDGSLTDAVGAWLLEAWPFDVVHYRLGGYPMVIPVPKQ